MPPPRIRNPRRRKLFLSALRETAMVAAASRAAGSATGSFYNWRYADEGFAADWDRALAIGVSTLEDEAIRRARDGVPTPVFFGGKQVATVRRYSDRLLMFLLKAHKPEIYGERRLLPAAGITGPLPEPGDILPDGRRIADLSLDELKREFDDTMRDLAEEPDEG